MLAVSAFHLKSALAENTIAECAPAQGFVDVPPPAIDRSDGMVSRTETILVDRPLGTVLTVVNRPLKDALRPTSSLPGVTGTYPLTQGDFEGPGSRRLVCLSDGSSTEEQVLTREHGENLYRFRLSGLELYQQGGWRHPLRGRRIRLHKTHSRQHQNRMDVFFRTEA